MPAAPHPLRLVALAAAGGALGGAGRAVAGLLLPGQGTATLVVNLVGCLALGLLVGRAPDRPALRAFAGTGLLGGFTTWSALAVEVDGRLPASPGLATAHLLVTLAGGLLLARLGLALGRRR